ncbi:hypothetical protein RJ55_04556 [Drechmeria coniospora]|nr:hypothetical protein RJ55_04556 [Drechmeria coniospora]
MAEYLSLKVPELKKLLAEKKLPLTGNKADLVGRLQEHDKKNARAADDSKPKMTPAAGKAETKEDEIDYSDDEDVAPAAAASKAAGGGAAASAPESASAPDAAPAAPASATSAAAVESVAPTKDAEGEKAPETAAASFTIGLSATAADEEAKKRAERAKRFGLEGDEEAKKKAERAKRFGIDEKELATGLDSALPERPLKRGRGRDGGDDANRGAKRQSLDRHGRRQGGNRPEQDRRNGSERKKAPGVLDDPIEREKAAKRAARFAAT